jgi:hypothetical protein
MLKKLSFYKAKLMVGILIIVLFHIIILHDSIVGR